MAVNTIMELIGGKVTAKPTAGPSNGPVQGVATKAARMPLKKEPIKGLEEEEEGFFWANEMNEVPTSKTPNMLSPSKKITNDKITINAGSCK